jgi:hypothetical protein
MARLTEILNKYVDNHAKALRSRSSFMMPASWVQYEGGEKVLMMIIAKCLIEVRSLILNDRDNYISSEERLQTSLYTSAVNDDGREHTVLFNITHIEERQLTGAPSYNCRQDINDLMNITQVFNGVIVPVLYSSYIIKHIEHMLNMVAAHIVLYALAMDGDAPQPVKLDKRFMKYILSVIIPETGYGKDKLINIKA